MCASAAQVESYQTISLMIDARGVARVALNRPEVHNAFNEVMIEDLTLFPIFLNEQRGSTCRSFIKWKRFLCRRRSVLDEAHERKRSGRKSSGCAAIRRYDARDSWMCESGYRTSRLLRQEVQEKALEKFDE